MTWNLILQTKPKLIHCASSFARLPEFKPWFCHLSFKWTLCVLASPSVKLSGNNKYHVFLFISSLCMLLLYLYISLLQGPKPVIPLLVRYIFSDASFTIRYEWLMTLNWKIFCFNIYSFDSFIPLKRKGSSETGGLIQTPALQLTVRIKMVTQEVLLIALVQKKYISISCANSF